jgi:hypothetical protein
VRVRHKAKLLLVRRGRWWSAIVGQRGMGSHGAVLVSSESHVSIPRNVRPGAHGGDRRANTRWLIQYCNHKNDKHEG